MVDGVRKKNKSLFLLLDNLKVKASIALFLFLNCKTNNGRNATCSKFTYISLLSFTLIWFLYLKYPESGDRLEQITGSLFLKAAAAAAACFFSSIVHCCFVASRQLCCLELFRSLIVAFPSTAKPSTLQLNRKSWSTNQFFVVVVFNHECD